MDVLEKAKTVAKQAVDTATTQAKQTVDSAKHDVSKSGVKALLTKRYIIIAAVVLVVVIGGFMLIFGGGSEYVGTWVRTTNEHQLVLSRNGTYELTRVSDGSIVNQGRWRIGEFGRESEARLHGTDDLIIFYNIYIPGSPFQPTMEHNGPIRRNGNRLSAPTPDSRSSTYNNWTRVR